MSHVVQAALYTGHLTAEAEAIIRTLSDVRCDLADTEALIALQQALGSGKVKRLSQERRSQRLTAEPSRIQTD